MLSLIGLVMMGSRARVGFVLVRNSSALRWYLLLVFWYF